MKAYYYKRDHVFAPYILTWFADGWQRSDSFSDMKELKKYAKAMGFTLCNVNDITTPG